MGRIHRLPSDVANQIAAGEVVERPASIVKELVENALDADARRVTVTIEYGGKRLVRVEDDGSGMDPEDARLAIERHATSKLHRAEDLAAIATLGFRGEALPSIASVSHFTLRTRARGRESGSEIRVHAGAVASVTEAGMPEGTRIDVEEVFYNLPARRKFLKSDGAESAHVSRTVTQLALSAPTIGFTLISAGRRLLECPPVVGLADRLYQLYGEPDDLVRVEKEAAGVRITGYAAGLAETGPRRGPQNIFINGRMVRDKTITHAIIDAYSVASIKERSPEVHLFIEMPLDAVDVNVHPSKAEVRFREQSLIHELVRRALGDALGRGPAPPLVLTPPAEIAGLPGHTMTLPGVLGSGSYPSRWQAPGSRLQAPGGVPAPEPPTQEAGQAPGPGAWSPQPGAAAPSIRPMIPLGQFRDTFIIAVDDEGIAIIDQHVAHERVLFERTIERLTAGRLQSQRLLHPLLLDLTPDGRQALVAHAADLERLGFEVEEFGGDSVRVCATPALLDAESAAAAVRALAQDLEGLDRGARVEETLKRIAATIACHAAVKANYPLTYDKMVHILAELRATAYSTICPHGRPVMLRLTRREVEKNFGRI
ncbi:MAG TPA: DNA mismatch repair endonuclease MutL [Vicinamibacterales bacterium]|nr:DNA mismatch repair endonuclease MutL [Vicinamibacterales bacterium]